MTILLSIIHVIVALFLIVVVLLQTGKRADLAGAFGGGGSQTAFGARGAVSVLSKATTAAAVLFMLTSMSLAILSSRSGSSGGDTVLDEVAPTRSEAPAGTGGDLPALPPPTEGSAPTPPSESTVPGNAEGSTSTEPVEPSTGSGDPAGSEGP